MLKAEQPKPTSDFIRIFSLLHFANRLRTGLLFLLLGAQSAFELIFIASLTFMGMAFGSPDVMRAQFPFSTLFRFFPDIELWAQEPGNLLLLSAALVVCISLFKNCVSFFAARQTSLLSERISIDIGREIMSRYMYMDYAWHLSKEGTDTFQRMTWRGSVANILVLLLSIYAYLLTLIVMMFSLMHQEPLLTFMVVAITSMAGALLYLAVRNSVDRLAIINTESAREETRAILCATKGIRDVLIYRKQPAFVSTITRAAQKGVLPRTYSGLAATLPSWVLEFVGFAVMAGAIFYLVHIVQADQARIVTSLSLLLITAWRVLPYSNRIVSCKVGIRSARPMAIAVIELLEVLRMAPTEVIAPDPGFTIRRSIAFDKVHFRYPNAKTYCLVDLSLEIPVGAKIGIIGPSGAGKSSLVGVLCGLLPPSKGRILVDGKEMSPEQAAAYSSFIGYVPQTPFLFAGTLAQNVAFRDWGGAIDMERVQRACDAAAIDFAGAHPKGLERPIGENGAGLSGGQAQRVSIARALYCDPKLIIFDEATSSLDKFNESAIQKTIYSLADRVTCVIIAHRLETVRQCDTLIWLDEGKIVQIGPPSLILPLYQGEQKN